MLNKWISRSVWNTRWFLSRELKHDVRSAELFMTTIQGMINGLCILSLFHPAGFKSLKSSSHADMYIIRRIWKERQPSDLGIFISFNNKNWSLSFFNVAFSQFIASILEVFYNFIMVSRGWLLTRNFYYSHHVTFVWDFALIRLYQTRRSTYI